MSKLTIQTFFSLTDPKKIADPAILAKIGDFNAYYACGVLFLATAIVLIVVSLATKAQEPEQIKGLTFSSINKEEVRASIHPVDIVTTLVVVAAILTIYLYFSFWTVGHEPAAVQAAQDLADQAGQFLQ